MKWMCRDWSDLPRTERRCGVEAVQALSMAQVQERGCSGCEMGCAGVGWLWGHGLLKHVGPWLLTREAGFRGLGEWKGPWRYVRRQDPPCVKWGESKVAPIGRRWEGRSRAPVQESMDSCSPSCMSTWIWPVPPLSRVLKARNQLDQRADEAVNTHVFSLIWVASDDTVVESLIQVESWCLKGPWGVPRCPRSLNHQQSNCIFPATSECHSISTAAAAAKSLQSCPTLCDSINGSPPALPTLGFSRQEHWSGLPNSSKSSLLVVTLSITATRLRQVSMPKRSVFKSGCWVMMWLRRAESSVAVSALCLQSARQRASGTAGLPHLLAWRLEWGIQGAGSGQCCAGASRSCANDAAQEARGGPAGGAPAVFPQPTRLLPVLPRFHLLLPCLCLLFPHTHLRGACHQHCGCESRFPHAHRLLLRSPLHHPQVLDLGGRLLEKL